MLRSTLIAALVAFTAVFSACGGSGRGDEERPPEVLTIAAQIGDDEVTASPSKFGAGPITIIASNQTQVAQKLELDGPRVNRVLPVDPQDTATLKVTLEPGEYTLETETSEQVPPFTLQISKQRGSTQDRLLLP